MKKIFLFSMLALAGLASKAQIYYPDGTTITSTVAITDINNVTYDLFTMTNQGKHVIIDLSATWCGPCWSYHQSKVLDHYYDKYGPTGTSPLKDGMAFLYEVDNSSTMPDLQGNVAGSTSQTGPTQGDWITGTTHPICNPANANSVVLKFVQPGQSYGVPAVFVVCNNRKLYKISTGITDEPGLRSYITGVCGLAPASATEVMDLGFTYDIYPNPATEATTIHLNLDNASTVSYAVKNSMGQTVTNTVKQDLNSGSNKIDISTANLANGIYFVALQVGNRNINARILVQH
ncbi:MAG: T9SS type A sorting domain-containing protein [Chitinophagaceae bacterium]|nr:T9SS type A sorting domain-containing protein [Chitinophagaceae bacterium]